MENFLLKISLLLTKFGEISVYRNVKRAQYVKITATRLNEKNLFAINYCDIFNHFLGEIM